MDEGNTHREFYVTSIGNGCWGVFCGAKLWDSGFTTYADAIRVAEYRNAGNPCGDEKHHWWIIKHWPMEEVSEPVDTSVKGPTRYLEKLTSGQRKQFPMAEGLIDYFPDALAVASHVSYVGNEKHNPGEPLHHARGKSMDHADCVVRHWATRDEIEHVVLPDGREFHIPHWAYALWRIAAYGQEWMEREYNLSLPKGARDGSADR